MPEPIYFLTGMPETAPVISQVTAKAKSVTLSWADVPLSPSYRVEYKIGSGDWLTPSAVGFGWAAATIYSLQPQTSYQFRVIAVNDTGVGPWSDAVSATTSVQQSYTISSCAQLQNMNNDLEGLYTLTTDLDCTETAGWNNGRASSRWGSIQERSGVSLMGVVIQFQICL